MVNHIKLQHKNSTMAAKDIEKHKFKKGQTGNPNGRPRKLPALDKLMADVLGEEKDGITAGEAILKALRAKATKGDVRAAEVLLDRAYGKPKQTHDTNITSTEPLVIIRTEPKSE
jgi:hypothetical protein